MWFVFDDAPWFARGWYHAYGVGAGEFTFHYTRGFEPFGSSFRVLLVLCQKIEKNHL